MAAQIRRTRDQDALHYPPYWHYDVLTSLLLLGRAGEAADRGPPMPSITSGRACRGIKSGPPDVVDSGRSQPNEMITFNALRALGSAGALD